jgi:O-antigen/teichoic acid export membrane protein
MKLALSKEWFEGTAGRRKTIEQTVAAIADRVLLGIATFLTGVLVGRSGTPEEFGAFTLGMTAVFFAIAAQESLLAAPYTVCSRDYSDGDQRRYLGSVFLHLLMLSGGLASLLIATAAVAYAVSLVEVSVLLLTLGLVIPPVLVREFARRIDYADLRPRNAVLLSGGVSLFQLALTFLLFATGRLHPASALAVIGVASLGGAMAWLASYWKRMEFDLADLRPAFASNMVIGRWIFATQMSEMARIQALPWLLAAIIDTAAAGLYAACYAISSLASPVLIAVSNIVVPQIVHQEHEGGVRAVRRFVAQTTAWLTCALAAYSAALCATSAFIVQLVYGADYSNTAHTLIVLSVAQVFLASNLAPARALMVFKRADLAFWSQLASLAPTAILGAIWILWFGPVGAAYALLAGAAVKVVSTYWLYRAEVSRRLASEPPAVVGMRSDMPRPMSGKSPTAPLTPHAGVAASASPYASVTAGREDAP